MCLDKIASHYKRNSNKEGTYGQPERIFKLGNSKRNFGHKILNVQPVGQEKVYTIKIIRSNAAEKETI